MIRELETIYGRMFVPETDDGQYSWLLNTGAAPDDDCIEECCGLVQLECAVDVGASFGTWTLALAKRACRVVAYEPQPQVFGLLKTAVGANNLHHVQVHNAAVGDNAGTVMIPDLDLDTGVSFGSVSLLLPFIGPRAEVPMVILDDTLAGEQVSFIKIDVEGYEDKVLAGATRVIRRCRPVLFFEMDHPRSDADRLRKQVEQMGYMIDKRHNNFLAMPL